MKGPRLHIACWNVFWKLTLRACTLRTSQKPPLFWYNHHSHDHNSWPLIWIVRGTKDMLLCHFIYIAHHAKLWLTVKGQHIGGACGTGHKEEVVYVIPCDVPQVAVDMATREKLSREFIVTLYWYILSARGRYYSIQRNKSAVD